MTYSTKEVAELTGATLRQLQWMDDESLVELPSEGFGCHRKWTGEDVIRAAAILKLRRLGTSVFRKALDAWDRVGSPDCFVVATRPKHQGRAVPIQRDYEISVVLPPDFGLWITEKGSEGFRGGFVRVNLIGLSRKLLDHEAVAMATVLMAIAPMQQRRST